jgi:hypothetical protein
LKFEMNDICLVLLGNYYNTFSNKSSFYSASPSYLHSYFVYHSHQVGSLIHHIHIIYTCIHTRTHTHTHAHTHTRTHTYMFATYGKMPPEIWTLERASVLPYTHTHTQTQTILPYTHTHKPYSHVYMPPQTHNHTPINIHGT